MFFSVLSASSPSIKSFYDGDDDDDGNGGDGEDGDIGDVSNDDGVADNGDTVRMCNNGWTRLQRIL